MPSYEETISTIKELLPKVNRWWPNYFFHYTDVHNALGIIREGWIYGRNEAINKNLMQIDNASQSVIDITSERIKSCGRLYFRPRTPTQYHNEGFKPLTVRLHDLNANCPVPIFFLLDSLLTLKTQGVGFAEKGCAGKDIEFLSGDENFSKLCFPKIYHDGPFSQGSDIGKYRRSEIIRKGGIPILNTLRWIVCRSLAEKQTLLFMLRSSNPQKYDQYQNLIKVEPYYNLFMHNGIYIRNVSPSDGFIQVELNDPRLRYTNGANNPELIKMEITISWLDYIGNYIDREKVSSSIDYNNISIFRIIYGNRRSEHLLLEINFETSLMYKNLLNISDSELVN